MNKIVLATAALPTLLELVARLEIVSERLNSEINEYLKTTILQDSGKTISQVINPETLTAALNTANHYYYFRDDDGSDIGETIVWIGAAAAFFTAGAVLYNKFKSDKKHQKFVSAVERVGKVEALLGIKSRGQILQEILQRKEEKQFLRLLGEEQLALVKQEEKINKYFYLFPVDKKEEDLSQEERDLFPDEDDRFFAEQILLKLEGNFVKLGEVPKQEFI